MWPKVQLIHLDVNYQRMEQVKTRARLDDLKKPKVISREKPPSNFSFKPMTFDLPTPKDIVLPKKNHSTSPPSSLGFVLSFPKRTYFLFLKQPPLVWRNETFFLYHFIFFSFPPRCLHHQSYNRCYCRLQHRYRQHHRQYYHRHC